MITTNPLIKRCEPRHRRRSSSNRCTNPGVFTVLSAALARCATRSFLILATAAFASACDRSSGMPATPTSGEGLIFGLPAPVVTGVEPASAAPGSTIRIFGRNLKPSGAILSPLVRFSDQRSGVRGEAVSDGEMTVVVPSGTGAVTLHVETAGGTSSGVSFTYKAPKITLVNPSAGKPKEPVGIAGEGFGVKGYTSGSILMFGKSQVYPESWEDRIIVVNAPGDLGTGLNTDILFDLAGCVAGSELIVDLLMPGCEDLLVDVVARYKLTRGSDFVETTVPIVVHTSAGTSNPGSFTFRIGTRAPSAPTIAGYQWDRSPTESQPFSGTITGMNFITGATQVFFCRAGTATCAEHPRAGVIVTGAQSLNVRSVSLSAGAWEVFVKTQGGASTRSAAFPVAAPPPAAPTITGYQWDRSPLAGQPFSGTITGTNFTSGTQVYFCATGTNTCSEHPLAGVTVTNSASITVRAVNLGTGSWQVYVKTAGGTSARSAAFTVAVLPLPLPTISGYQWDRAPIGGQPFNGTVSGTGFVIGATQVFFCTAGTNTCSELPSGQVTVNGSGSLSVRGVNLAPGSWQVYVKTAGGVSGRSTAFTAAILPLPLPSVAGYQWDRTPTAGQPFNGTITGANFVAGGTQVFFCAAGTNTCYEHPTTGTTVSGSASISIRAVTLGAGSWQLFAKTAGGNSSRSSAFTVVVPPPAVPSVSGYQWDRTPTAGQAFNGTITGANFVAGGTQVFFCAAGTNTCYEHPTAGITVSGSASISIRSVTLAAGSWQLFAKTAGGNSSRSSAFTVVPPPPAVPVVSGYQWDRTPTAGQAFNGTITGANFVAGATRVFFCVAGSSTCYEHPSAGVAVTVSGTANVSAVNLAPGSWQVYVRTAGGSSSRSAAFTVVLAAPTIKQLSWDRTPTGSNPFNGTITGTGFVTQTTRVFFCVAGSNTCYEHPGAGVSVTGATSLTVQNVRLSTGSWQVYVATTAGASTRSTTFQVQ